MLKNTITIVGPCAAESREQILFSAVEAKKRNVDFLRVSLWKPRTKPGFDGLKEEGIQLMTEVAKMGVNPSTEVIIPQHAEKVIEAVLRATPKGKVLVWIGARNQNHYVQQEIARVASQNKRVYLLVKNQPWVSEEHWEGVVEHALHGGIAPENLIVCHRGFSPNGHNPHGYRNVPDYEMTKRIKEKTGLPMVFDPSHTAGNVANVFKIAQEAADQDIFDGLIVEVHPNPKEAKTDAKQQLTWKEYDKLAKPKRKK